MHFYREVLSFQENSLIPQVQIGDAILRGYVPHIIAFNTWAGQEVPSALAGACGYGTHDDVPGSLLLLVRRASPPGAEPVHQLCRRCSPLGVSGPKTNFTQGTSHYRVMPAQRTLRP
jgi:hypothetical protein